MTPEHWTVRVEERCTLDLTGARLHRLHGQSDIRVDLPRALRAARGLRTVASNSGWSVTAGWLTSKESFLAVQPPAGQGGPAAVVFGLHIGAGADAAAVAKGMTPSLRGLFSRSVNPTDPLVRLDDDRLWRTVLRIYEIGASLPQIPEPNPLTTEPRRWLEHVLALEWAMFPTETETQPWRDLRLRGNASATFAAAGHTPKWSAPWIWEQFSVSDAEHLDRLGWQPRLVLALEDLCDAEDPGSEEALREAHDWMNGDLAPRTAVLAYAAGLTFEEATAAEADLDENRLATLAALRDVTRHLGWLDDENTEVPQ